MMEDIKKLLEKQNFLTLSRYIALEEIECLNGTDKETLIKLTDIYSDEIRKINKSMLLYRSILQHRAKKETNVKKEKF